MCSKFVYVNLRISFPQKAQESLTLRGAPRPGCRWSQGTWTGASLRGDGYSCTIRSAF